MTDPGWYPNPDGTPTRRYWDGARWTEHTQLTAPPTPPAYVTPAYQSPGYVAPAYQMAGMGPSGPVDAPNGIATAGMVLGILSVVFFFGGILTLAGGILGICFGGVGLKRSRFIGGRGSGAAKAGITLGIIAICIYFVLGIVTLGILWFI